MGFKLSDLKYKHTPAPPPKPVKQLPEVAELPIRECKEDENYFHQHLYSVMDLEGKVTASVSAVFPTGDPYIIMEKGPNKGKRYIMDITALGDFIDENLMK